MNFSAAKTLLDSAVRWELRDHAFGDTEFGWDIGGVSVATGYAGGGRCDIYFEGGKKFTGDDARELRSCGSTGVVERNDETGPNEYNEGVVMPGLTLKGVRRQLMEEGW